MKNPWIAKRSQSVSLIMIILLNRGLFIVLVMVAGLLN